MAALDLTTGRVALIVVDISAAATNGESTLEHVGQEEAVPKAVEVLRAARAVGMPVIHVKEVHRKEVVDFGRVTAERFVAVAGAAVGGAAAAVGGAWLTSPAWRSSTT